MAGNLYVVAAPSGAGKTTLVRLLLEHEAAVQLSISYTTRAPRPGEESGREYHFVDAPAQAEMRHVGEFDYVIINDQLAQALDDLCAVVRASRLSFGVQRERHAALFQRMI